MIKICIPLNLYHDERIDCGCGHVIKQDETAYIVMSGNVENKIIKRGHSGLAFCGECLYKHFPEFKVVK